MKRNKNTYNIILTAILAALSFAAVYIQIPLPTGGMIHLGNFVCILAGLLCGGLIGGISGSLGMGLWDIFNGEPWTTSIRTFILKFIIGFLAGTLFRVFIKKDKTPLIGFYIFAACFLAFFLFSTILYVQFRGDTPFVSEVPYTFNNVTKTLKVTILIPIFSGIFSIMLVLAAIFAKKLIKIQKIVLFTSTITLTLNVILTFVLGILFKGIVTGFDVAFVDALLKIPSGLMTSIITIILVTFLYYPIYIALKNTNLIEDLNINDNKNLEK